MTNIRCGTYAGYQLHGRDGTPRCQECRDAYNAYHRELRRRNPDTYTRDKAAQRVQQRAMRRLAKENPRRLVELIIEEQAKEGGP